MSKLAIVAAPCLLYLAADIPCLLRRQYLNQGAYRVYHPAPTC
jgi:hypothetical protein